MKNTETAASPIGWQRPDHIRNIMFISIFFANMALNFGQQMSNSLLAIYADSFGAPASQVGMLMSMFALTALIFRFVSGPAMDSFNRKYLVMLAMGVMGIAYLGFSFSKTIGGLMFFRLIQGIGNAFANACCLTIVADTLPEDKFNAGIGYYSVAQVVSQATGPAIGLELVKWFGYSNTYRVNCAVMLLAVLFVMMIKLPHREPKKFSMRLDHIIAREAVAPASVTFFVGLGFTAINAFLIVYAAKRGVIKGIGFFFTVYALTLALTRPAVGKLTDKIGFVKVAIPAIVMTISSLLLIGFSSVLWMFLLAAFINAFGYGAIQPAIQALCMKSVPDSRRGSAAATQYIALDSATLIGPAVAGFIADQIGYSPAIWAAMAAPLVVAIIVVFAARKTIVKIETNFRKKIN
jgi:MFS family permease